MAENTHDLREKRGYRHHDIVLKQAYVKGKYDQIYVTTGRCMISIGNGNVFEDDSDILIIGHNINDKVKLEALLAQNLGGHRLQLGDTKSKLIGSRLTYAPVENTTIKAEYVSFRDLGYKDFDDVGHSVNMDIFAISTSTKVAKDLKANVVYIRGNAKAADTDLKATSKNGYVAGLAYKGAVAEKKGSWGVNVNYYNQGAQSYIDHAIEGNTDVLTSINLINRRKNLVLIDGNMSFPSGFKGWSIGTDWVLVKNLVAKLAYYDTKDKEGGNSDRRVWNSLTWSF